MPKRAEDPQKLIPPWWKVELYDYMETMPLLGWIWEFARRQRLLELGGKPVEAMKPAGVFGYHKVPAATLNTTWESVKLVKERPVFIPLAVEADELPDRRPDPPRFSFQELWVDAYEGTDHRWHSENRTERYTTLKVDLSRRDTAIKADFDVVLQKLRVEIQHQPKRISPRLGQWRLNRLIAAWDLSQWHVSYKGIEELLNLNEDCAKNALREARGYIDRKGWQTLALNADLT